MAFLDLARKKAAEEDEKLRVFLSGTTVNTSNTKNTTNNTKNTTSNKKTSGTTSSTKTTSKGKLVANKGKTPILDSAFKAAAEERKSGTTYGSTPKLSYKGNTQSPKDYSSTVKYLEAKGVRGASGIMTENEWRRRKGASANTYQDYLDGVINKYGKGNIDLTDRPIYKNPDGTISTVASHIIGADNKYFVLPSIVRDKNGNVKKFEASDDVYNHFKDTGEYLGIFDTQEEAVEYAQNLYIEQQAYYLNNKKSSANSYKDVKEVVELIKKIEDAKARTTDDYFNKRREEEIARLKNVPQADNIAYWETEDAKKEVKELTKQLNRYIDGAREANFYDSTIGAFKRSYYNMKYGKEAYEKKQGMENEADKYKELLASDEFNTYTDNKALQTLQFIGDWLGQQFYIASDPRTAGSVAAAGTMAALAGQLVPLPEEALTVPGAMLTGYKASAITNTYETSAGHTYETLKSLGVSDEVASIAADGVGFGVGMLEAMQLDELVDAYVVGSTNGASDNVLKIIGAEILKRAKNTTFETTEELLQEIVTIAGEDVAYKVDKGEHLYTTDEVKERLGETAETSFMGFGAMNVPAVAFNTTRAVRSNYANQKIANLGKQSRDKVQYQIEKGLKQTEGTTAQKLATELKDKEHISDIELGNLVLANELAFKETMELDFARDPELLKLLINEAKEVGGKSKNLANNVEKKLNTGNEVSVEDVKKLIASNEIYIQEEARIAKQTAEPELYVSPIMETVEAKSKKGQAVSVDEVQKATSFGKSGAELVTDYTNVEGRTFNEVVAEVKPAYFAGISQPDMDVTSMEKAFVSDMQKQAFQAGQIDRKIEDMRFKARSENAVVYGGTFTENEFTKNFTKQDRILISTIAKSFGMDVSTVDKIIANEFTGAEANALHKGGKMEISNNRDAHKAVFRLVLHEGGHRMSELAPEEFGALMNALYKFSTRANEKVGRSQTSGFDNVKSDYDRAGLTMNTLDYFEEFAVQEIEGIFGSARAFNRWYAEISGNQQARTAWQKIVDYIFEIIDDIKRALSQAKLSKAERAEANAQLERIKELYANAYKAAENAVTEKRQAQTKQNSDINSAKNLEIKTNEEYNENINYSLYWRTDLNRTQYKQVEKWIRQAGNPETTRITDTANWYKGRINGEDLFVIYSDKSTILYERKGVEAKLELDILLEHLEEIENGRSIVDLSKDINTLLGGDWMQTKHNLANNNAGLGRRGSNTGYASVLQGKPSKFIGSQAFRNVVKNILSIQEERDGELNEGKSYSLKNSTSENISHSLYTDEVIFSSRYNAIFQSQSVRELYDNAKKGNVESAYELISQLLTENDINKIKSFGDDAYLMPVVGAEGTSSNVLPSTIAEYINAETGQTIFDGVRKETSSDSRSIELWDRMKENYPSFVIDQSANIKTSDIEGKTFVLIDDNSTTGRTFVGFRNFLEENGGKVAGYYALTTGQDQSEKMVTTDKTWNEIVSLGIDAVRDFAENEGVKREISKRGLTERESQILVSQFKRKKADARRGGEVNAGNSRSKRAVQGIYDTEKKTGNTGKGDKVNFSLEDSEGNTLTEEQKEPSIPYLKQFNTAEELTQEIERVEKQSVFKMSMEEFRERNKTIEKLKRKRYRLQHPKSAGAKALEKSKSEAKAKLDKDYFTAIENGDLETAQKMVVEYAKEMGYEAEEDYRMTHSAPTNDGISAPIYELDRIYPKDVYENGVRYYGIGESYEYEAMQKMKAVRGKPDAKIWIYRAVPSDVKENKVRNGDWITVSKEYAELHGKRNIEGSYRIIKQLVSAKHVWTNADSLAEQGYDNGNLMAYANTANNAKLLNTITYTNDGKIIPLSKRFNKRNSDARYSLKNWHTDLSKNDLNELMNKIKYDILRSKNAITDEANWLFTDIGGKDVFAIYSTDDYKDPTLLYEVKGKKANLERDILLDVLEVYKSGENTDGKSMYVDWVFGGGWMQKINSVQNNKRNLGRGRSNRDVRVLQGQSQSNGSRAFWNVIENLFEIQRENRLDGVGGRGVRDGVNHSLKGTLSDSEIRNAITDKKLHKYVDKGIITTEKYDELVKTYGAIPSGEKPYREIQVPQKTAKDKKVSQTVRTILEAKATPDEAVPTIEKMVEDGIFSYDVYTDKQALDEANSNIKKYGWDESIDDWFKDVEKGVVSKEHTAMGWALYNNAANIAATTTSETERTSAIKTSLKILDAMVRHQRSAAQALQATRILKKLSPETQLYAVQKSVQAFQKELSDKYGDKAPNLEIDVDLAEQFLNAKTPEERAEIEIEIYKDIGRQMPSRFVDKWNAWRYLAMLGNVRTHVRNIGGNAFFAPVVMTKDLGATAIESIVHRVSGKKTVRGKALITGSKADRALLKAAWGDYGNVADLISNGGKYSDFAMANQKIEDGRQIFKFKPLELARKGNSVLLEKEDMWFSRPHYAYALAQYCKANNITAEQIKRGKAIAPARDYAIKEAQKATYRDTNAFSQFVSDLGKNGKVNYVPKPVSMMVDGILPFRKTPANILVRGVEYSPLGLLKGLSYDLYQVSKGKMSATEAIDNISAGLTGTGLLGLGVYLAAQGLIRGHGEDDEEEKEFKELMGHQSYALELPNGQSITLDWLAPEALTFFVGVNIWETTKGSDEEVTLSTILNAIRNITEPMLEMSCLQGLNDLFEGIGYAKSNDTSALVAFISSAVKSYLMQGLPTILGQAERTGEEHRMTTYTEKDDFLTGDMQYTLGKASAKIPFWDYHQIPYIDAWGRKEASGVALKRGLNNFLNPAYTSTVEASKMEKELLRLYESTGEASVFPSRADKYFTVDKKRKDLTTDEYVRYATLKGKKSYKLITDLVQSDAYKLLDDGEKVKAIEEAYDYANQKAKEAISNYKADTWVSKADEFSDVGSYITFRTEVSATKKENGDKISRQEVADIILDMAQNDSDMWNMYLSMYDSKGDKYAYDSGVSGEAYMYFLETLNEVDAPNKSGKYGTYTQAEATAAVNQLEGLSREEQRALWQSVNTTWKKNPF